MSWKTWSLFQSPAVNEICSHLTKQEHSKLVGNSASYGLVLGICCTPINMVIGEYVAFNYLIQIENPTLFFNNIYFISLAIFLVGINIMYIRHWQNEQREYLCSTEWAKSQGYTPENLELYSFNASQRG